VRNNKLQEGKKHDQAAYSAKADQGHRCTAKQTYEELKCSFLWLMIKVLLTTEHGHLFLLFSRRNYGTLLWETKRNAQ